jgi:hypothetical protein
MKLNGAGAGAAVLALAAAAGVPAAAVAAPTIWVKTGVAAHEAQATYDACYQDVQGITGTDTMPYYRRGPVVVQVPAGASAGVRNSYMAAGAAGGLIGGLLVYSVEQNIAAQKARAIALPRCMHQKGYHQMTLTAQEDSQQHSQDAEKHVAWLEAFYSRPDFAQRVAEASRLPTRLPETGEARPPSTVLGSLQFDPSALSAAPGVVKTDGAVLIGPVGHWRTATLKADVYLRDVKGGVLHAGSPLQLAVLDDAASSYWCTTEDDTHVCLRMQGDYYVSIPAKGPWWGVAHLAPNAAESGDIDNADIVLQEDGGGPDAVGAVDFSLEVRQLGDKTITLAAVGRLRGEQHEFWRNELDFDAKGKASLSLWNYRLELTRTKGGVTARYERKPAVN